MPSPSFSTSSHAPPRPPSPSPSPSQSVLHIPSDDDDMSPPRLQSNSHRRSSSTRWTRFLHFFQPSRRRRAANATAPSPPHTRNHHHHPHNHHHHHHHPLHQQHSPFTPTLLSRPLSSPLSSSHHSQPSPPPSIEMRRARRERHRFRQSQSRPIISASATPLSIADAAAAPPPASPPSATLRGPSAARTGGARSRRTMSDGALHHAAVTSASTSSTTSTSPLPPQPHQLPPPPPPVPLSPLWTSHTILPSHTTMRFRRTATASVDGASVTSLAGVASAGSGLSDSDDSNAHDDILHRLHSSGSATGSLGTAPSVTTDSRDGRASAILSSASTTDVDTMPQHELFTVVDRLFDDYTGAPSDSFQSSPVYMSRLPAHARQRLAMRVHNAYYISGRRHGRGYSGGTDSGMRIGMGGMPVGMTGMHGHGGHAQHGAHNHHYHHYHHGHGGGGPLHGAMHGGFDIEDREVRLSMMHPVRVDETSHGGYETAASDAQIEALPSFVMEKGETRSVKEIFESMRRGGDKKREKKTSAAEKEDDRKEKTEKETNEEGDTKLAEEDAEKSLKDEEDVVLVVETKDGDVPDLEKVGTTDEDEEMDKDSDDVGDDKEYDSGAMTSYTECAICLCDFEPGDTITALPCGHFFHLTGCVREWLGKHARTCPTCRADICGDMNASAGDGGTGEGGVGTATASPTPMLASMTTRTTRTTATGMMRGMGSRPVVVSGSTRVSASEG